MCTTCGCGQPDDSVTIRKPGENTKDEHQHEHTHTYQHSHEHVHNGDEHSHAHSHIYSHTHEHTAHEHSHEHNRQHNAHEQDHNHSHGTEIRVEQDILQKNNLLAERNRGYFEAKNIFTLNLVSSPGSGKTCLLERTIKESGKELKFYIIEGDQQTMIDAERIEATGTPVVQVNTGMGCHLDSDMINKAVKKLDVPGNSVLMIENVGNLVCPSLFDLGEAKRIVIISVTEGEDKPVKYPTMFHTSDICIINKIDLLPYVDFNIDKVREYALQVNHHLQFFEMSVKTGEGMDKWYEWLIRQTGEL